MNSGRPPYPPQPPYYPPPPPPAPYGYGLPAPVPTQNVQYTMPVYPTAPSAWSTGVCGCCSDVSGCCLTCWCPCITFGQIAEIVDRGAMSCEVHAAIYAILLSFTCLHCLYSGMYRVKMRQQFMLPPSPCGCNDYFVHCWGSYRALCQEYRELKNRGFDMDLGWEGNVLKQNQGMMMMPPMAPGGMARF